MLCSVRSNRMHRARQYAFQAHGRPDAMPDEFHVNREKEVMARGSGVGKRGGGRQKERPVMTG